MEYQTWILKIPLLVKILVFIVKIIVILRNKKVIVIKITQVFKIPDPNL